MNTEQKNILLLHSFGLIDDPDIQQAIHDWIEVDPFAQQFLDPDSMDIHPSIQRKIDSIARRVELELLTDDIVCQNLTTLDESHQVVHSTSLEGTPFDRVATSLEVAMAAAPNDAMQAARPVHSEQERLKVDLVQRRVRIEYPTDDIPNGLAWIFFTSPSQRLSRALIDLNWDEYKGKTTWMGSIAISALTDDTSAAPSWFSVVPVTEDQRAIPSVLAHLTQFVASLPASKQKTIAEAFLNSTTDLGDEDE